MIFIATSDSRIERILKSLKLEFDTSTLETCKAVICVVNKKTKKQNLNFNKPTFYLIEKDIDEFDFDGVITTDIETLKDLLFEWSYDTTRFNSIKTKQRSRYVKE